ncbi:cytochrome P450 4C1 isoform X3 [Folsomia candida]|uniref:cytochrome P450 4C1 isoform X3 n=1 Tax=Folsomia candida TaxID=158441 RepID=UPI0016052E93|nr:cytochrome P450 4C1 isoform X3 [Folsomia candida]
MEFNLGTLVLWGASIISIYLVVIIPIINVLKFRRIPSHEAYPILGNLIAMWKCHDEFNKLFERWASKYGRGPVVVWGTYWFPIVVLGDAKDVKKVLCSRDHVSKGLFYRALDLAIGTGAFNAPVGIWKQRRPHLEQAFHSKVLQRLPSIFYLSSCELIQALQKDGHDTSGQTFDIHPYLSRCSIQMLIGGALGLEVDTFGGASKEFWKLAIQNYTRGTFLAEYRMLRPWYLFSSKIWNLTRLSKEMRTSVEWLHKFLFSQFLADKKRVDHEKNSTVQSSDKIMPQPKNFLELLLYLQNTKPELELSDQELIYEISSIYIAGTDATSKTLSFLILSLALHHDIQEKKRIATKCVTWNAASRKRSDYFRQCLALRAELGVTFIWTMGDMFQLVQKS